MIPHTGAGDFGVVVEDPTRMQDFYVGLLGFEKVAARSTVGGSMDEVRFGTSIVRPMQARGAPPQRAIGLDASTGIRYLTFDLNDFERTVPARRDAGGDFWLDVAPISDVFIAMLKDPEDNIVDSVGHGQ